MNIKHLYYIWLNTRLSPGSPTAKLLLEQYGDIEKIYRASPADLAAFELNAREAARLQNKDTEEAERLYQYCESERIGLLCYDNPYYPGRLKAIDNPPPLFYYRGKVELLDDHPCIAMVGTRSCSEKGFRTAYRMAYKAASYGAVVINGLALGTDTACMKGALDAGGYAVGLLGCGIDRIYPAQNDELFRRLSRQGLILSEFPPYTRPEARNFPVRNRVISGLSVASVIFEGAENSGALITAAHALAQGRRIFALPGDVNDPLYAGPLSLLKDGAQLVTDAEDIMTEYSLKFPHRINVHTRVTVPSGSENAAVTEAFSAAALEKNASAPAERHLPRPAKAPSFKTAGAKKRHDAPETDLPSESVLQAELDAASSASEPQKDLSILSATEQKLYSFFTQQSVYTVDELVAKGLKIDDLLSSLTLLEVYGFVRMLPGGRYERV